MDLTESSFGKKPLRNLVESEVGCGEKLEMPLARKEDMVTAVVSG